MKKIVLLASLVISSFSFAQNGNLSNSGFENWFTADSLNRLAVWTTNAGQNAQLATRSNDAQDLNASVKLETVDILGVPTAGLLVLGEFGQGLSGYPYPGLADSMIVFLKYNFQPSDSGTIIVAQFLQGTPIPNIFKVGGVQNNWTRHGFDLISPFQDSILILFSSGDLLGGVSIAGSTMQIDNVRMKAFLNTPTLPNFSFENWENIELIEPNDFFTTNTFCIANGIDGNVTKDSIAHTGNYSVRLETIDLGLTTIPGLLSNVEVNPFSGGTIGAAYTAAPTSLTGFYKYQGIAGNEATIDVLFFENGTVIENEQFIIDSPVSNFTPFTLNFNLQSTPDSMLFSVSSGDEIASVLWLDDLVFSGGTVGIEENFLDLNTQIFPNPANSWVFISSNEKISDIEIYTATGQKVKTITNKGLLSAFSVEELTSGFYTVVLIGEQRSTSRRLVIEK